MVIVTVMHYGRNETYTQDAIPHELGCFMSFLIFLIERYSYTKEYVCQVTVIID